MKAFLIPLTTVFVLCLSLRADEKNEDAVTTRTTIRDQIDLTISVPTKSVVGTPIIISIMLMNGSEEEIFYGETTKSRDFTVSVMNSRGKVVELTAIGEREIGGDRGSKDRNIMRTLAPGEQLRREYDLARWYALMIPETYRLIVSKEVNDIGPRQKETMVLTGEDISFQVVK